MQTYGFPNLIHFGSGARDLLCDRLKHHGCKAPLVVTDQGLASLPVTKDTMAHLEGGGQKPSLFSGVVGNPVESQVLAGVEAYKAGGCDSIVALGGGAPVDVAKSIALMVNHPGKLFDYAEAPVQPTKFVHEPIPPMLAIPTTAGTGSEVGRSAVISDDQTHVKYIIFDPTLLPLEVLADPKVLVDLPPHLTAATGVDALTHLVEAFIAKGEHPMADGIALEGLRLVGRGLIASTKDGKNLQARADMLNASLMGAVAFQKGLGATHSCAHALSTVCDLHHGLANGLMIHAVMSFNLEVCPERFDRMAKAITEGAGSGPSNGQEFLTWLKDLMPTLGLPTSLGSQGVDRSHLPKLVEVALADGCHVLNPRSVTQGDFEKLFEACL